MEQPLVAIAAYSALLHAALELPALLPVLIEDVADVREQLEGTAYADIDENAAAGRA